MFILDIESCPQVDLTDLFNKGIEAPKNYKDPDKIQAYIESKKEESVKGMSVDTDYADIICIGVKKIGGEITMFKRNELEKVFELIGNERIITYNGKGFDFPLIIKCGIKHGMKLDYLRLKEGMKKYGQDGNHIDLMEEICVGKFKKLDELLQIYLGVKKKEIDFAEATVEEVIEHCKEDLENTEKLFEKFKPLFI